MIFGSRPPKSTSSTVPTLAWVYLHLVFLSSLSATVTVDTCWFPFSTPLASRTDLLDRGYILPSLYQ